MEFRNNKNKKKYFFFNVQRICLKNYKYFNTKNLKVQIFKKKKINFLNFANVFFKTSF